MHISHAVVLLDIARAVQDGEASRREAHRRPAIEGRRQHRRRRRR